MLIIVIGGWMVLSATGASLRYALSPEGRLESKIEKQLSKTKPAQVESINVYVYGKSSHMGATATLTKQPHTQQEFEEVARWLEQAGEMAESKQLDREVNGDLNSTRVHWKPDGDNSLTAALPVVETFANTSHKVRITQRTPEISLDSERGDSLIEFARIVSVPSNLPPLDATYFPTGSTAAILTRVTHQCNLGSFLEYFQSIGPHDGIFTVSYSCDSKDIYISPKHDTTTIRPELYEAPQGYTLHIPELKTTGGVK